MQLAPRRAGQPGQQGVPDPVVHEAVLAAGPLQQAVLDGQRQLRHRVVAEDRRQQRGAEPGPDRRGDGQHLLPGLAQPVDPGQHQVQHVVRQLDPAQQLGVEHPGAPARAERTRVHQGPQAFEDRERVAATPDGDLGDQLGAHAGAGQVRRHQPGNRIGAERADPPGEVEPLAAGRPERRRRLGRFAGGSAAGGNAVG
ncbi:MAG TPA: hypothetical protein VMU51_33140, partial [Mycobacteriales bacterium]|nr:hypothetical protein [Mycobacteriales bacterium]